MMVGERALAFVPKQATPASPAPLLILFHGAGGAAQNMMKPFILEADKRGIALLAVQARGVTWDLVKKHFADVSQEASMMNDRDRLPGGDKRLVDEAIKQFRKQVPIDPARIATMGFSDGAAYALTYGAANSDSISWSGAMAPAFVTIERGARSKGQRIFIVHGTKDTAIPAGMSQGEVCPQLKKAGWTVRYEQFDGNHEMPGDVAVKMLDDWLVPASRPATDSANYSCGAKK